MSPQNIPWRPVIIGGVVGALLLAVFITAVLHGAASSEAGAPASVSASPSSPAPSPQQRPAGPVSAAPEAAPGKLPDRTVLEQRLNSQDVAALTRVPGLGPKGAQHVILDVADKLGPVTGDDLGTARTASQTTGGAEAMSDGGPEPHADVVAALVQLGWNEASAHQAVSSVTADAADGGQEPDMAAVLRASLRWLGGGHRG